MTCVQIGNAIVCGDFGQGRVERKRLACPTCKQRRSFLRVYSTSMFYGATDTCLGCGDSWSDGELRERPFARGWRQRAVAAAKAKLACKKK